MADLADLDEQKQQGGEEKRSSDGDLDGAPEGAVAVELPQAPSAHDDPPDHDLHGAEVARDDDNNSSNSYNNNNNRKEEEEEEKDEEHSVDSDHSGAVSSPPMHSLQDLRGTGAFLPVGCSSQPASTTLFSDGGVVNAVVVCFSQWYIIGCEDGGIHIWDCALAGWIASLTGHQQAVTCLAVCSDASWLCSGSNDGVLRLWDLETGEAFRTLHGHNTPITCCVVSPDNAFIASAGADGRIHVHSSASGENLSILKGHSRGVTALAVGPALADGEQSPSATAQQSEDAGEERGSNSCKTQNKQSSQPRNTTALYTCSTDKLVRIWDIVDGRRTKTLRHDDAVLCIAVDPQQRYIATGAGAYVYLWATTGKRTGSLLHKLAGHTGLVRGVAVFAKGTSIASDSDDDTIRLWSRETALCFRVIDHNPPNAAAGVTTGQSGPAGGGHGPGQGEGHGLVRRTLAISDDSQWVASTKGGEIRIRILGGSRRFRVLRPRNTTRGIALAPGMGNHLVTAHGDGMRIWHGEEPIVTAGGQDVTAVAVAEDGAMYASGTADGIIDLWDADGRSIARLSERHRGQVEAIEFSSGKQSLASAGHDMAIMVFELVSGGKMLMRTFQCSGFINVLRWAPHSHALVTSSNKVEVWSSDTGKRIFKAFNYSAAALAVSTDGQLLAAAVSDTVKLVGLHNGRPIGSLTGHTRNVTAVAFSASSGIWAPNAAAAEHDMTMLRGRPFGWLATSSLDLTVALWHMESGNRIRTLSEFSEPVQHVFVSGNGHWMVCATHDDIQYWKTEPTEVIAAYPCGDASAHASVNAVAISPDAFLVATACEDHMTRIFHRDPHDDDDHHHDEQQLHQTKKELRARGETCFLALPDHASSVISVVFSQSGRYLASGAVDGTTHCWESGTGRLVLTLQGSQPVRVVLFCESDHVLVTGDTSHIRLWNTQSGTRIRTLLHENCALAIAPSGKVLVSGVSGNGIQVVRTIDGQSMRVMAVPHTAPVTCLAWSLHGLFFASGGRDRRVCLWTTETRTLIRTLVGHTLAVSQVKIMPNGKHVISMDRLTLRFWSCEDGVCIRSFGLFSNAAVPGSVPRFASAGEGGPALTCSLAVDPDGHFVVTADMSRPGTAKLWDIASFLLEQPNADVLRDCFEHDLGRRPANNAQLTLPSQQQHQQQQQQLASQRGAVLRGRARWPQTTYFITRYPGLLLDGTQTGGTVMNDAIRHDRADFLRCFLPKKHRVRNVFDHFGVSETASSGASSADEVIIAGLTEVERCALAGIMNGGGESRHESMLSYALRQNNSALVSVVLDTYKRVWNSRWDPMRTTPHRGEPQVDPEATSELIPVLDLCLSLERFPVQTLACLSEVRLTPSPPQVLAGEERAIESDVVRGSHQRAPPSFWSKQGLVGYRARQVREATTLVTAKYVPIHRIAAKQSYWFLRSVIVACEETKNYQVFDSPVMKALLQFKWEGNVKALFMKDMCAYVLMVICFVLNALAFSEAQRSDNAVHNMLGFVPWALVWLGWLYFLRHEYRQAVSQFFSLSAHFGDFWNILDLGMLMLVPMCLLGQLVDYSRDEDTYRMSSQMLALTTPVVCLGALYYLQGGAQEGILIRTVVAVSASKQLGSFLVIMLVLILSFASSFFVLIRSGSGDVEHFDTVPRSLLSTFNYILGDFDVEDFHASSSFTLMSFLFVVYMIGMAVVLLNVLIAILNDKYASVQERSTAEWRFALANVVLEYEQLLFNSRANQNVQTDDDNQTYDPRRPDWLQVLETKRTVGSLDRGAGDAWADGVDPHHDDALGDGGSDDGYDSTEDAGDVDKDGHQQWSGQVNSIKSDLVRGLRTVSRKHDVAMLRQRTALTRLFERQTAMESQLVHVLDAVQSLHQLVQQHDDHSGDATNDWQQRRNDTRRPPGRTAAASDDDEDEDSAASGSTSDTDSETDAEVEQRKADPGAAVPSPSAIAAPAKSEASVCPAAPPTPERPAGQGTDGEETKTSTVPGKQQQELEGSSVPADAVADKEADIKSVSDAAREADTESEANTGIDGAIGRTDKDNNEEEVAATSRATEPTPSTSLTDTSAVAPVIVAQEEEGADTEDVIVTEVKEEPDADELSVAPTVADSLVPEDEEASGFGIGSDHDSATDSEPEYGGGNDQDDDDNGDKEAVSMALVDVAPRPDPLAPSKHAASSSIPASRMPGALAGVPGTASGRSAPVAAIAPSALRRRRSITSRAISRRARHLRAGSQPRATSSAAATVAATATATATTRPGTQATGAGAGPAGHPTPPP